jgi:GTP-binding protein YchF
MGLSVGIVGLPNVGKSTLFNSLSSAKAEAANYPFCTIEPNVGVVLVPDERLAALDSVCHAEKLVPTTVEFVDIAGLVRGASKGEGLGNQFLAHIREVDAIAQVARCFEDPNVVHVENRVDPVADLETVNVELCLKDLDTVQKRLDRARKGAKGSDPKEKLAVEITEALAAHLEKAKPARTCALPTSPDALAIVKDMPRLTGTPMKKGARAPQAAGVIHTDFERGFIRAEIVWWEDFVKLGGESKARDQGKLATVGKEYVMRDGDVTHFLFNV